MDTSYVVFFLLWSFGFLAASESHYTDDSDYEDLDYYKEPPEKRLTNVGGPDDFYILTETGEPEDRNRRQDTNKPVIERSYRYTKYRIAGHDYEELEYNKDLCTDERTVWSHCVCQFTCAQPSIVDCYEPCDSGCECREQYVYDERIGECVKPDKCSPEDDYLLY